MFRTLVSHTIANLVALLLLGLAVGLVVLVIMLGIAWLPNLLGWWIVVTFAAIALESGIWAIFASAKEIDAAIEAYVIKQFREHDKRWLKKHTEGQEKG